MDGTCNIRVFGRDSEELGFEGGGGGSGGFEGFAEVLDFEDLVVELLTSGFV